MQSLTERCNQEIIPSIQKENFEWSDVSTGIPAFRNYSKFKSVFRKFGPEVPRLDSPQSKKSCPPHSKRQANERQATSAEADSAERLAQELSRQQTDSCLLRGADEHDVLRGHPREVHQACQPSPVRQHS